MTQALIVDGYALFRASVRDILHATGFFSDILEAANSGEFISSAASDNSVSLAVIHPRSIGLSETDCLNLTGRVMKNTHILLFRDGETPIASSANDPRVTILPRAANCDDVTKAVEAIKTTAALAPAVTHRTARTQNPAPVGSDIARNLSYRQRQVMAMVAEGLANKEIAHRLGIAEGTVKAHIHAVFRALGVTNRTQAVIRFGSALRMAAAC